jgi:hypothetical protein
MERFKSEKYFQTKGVDRSALEIEVPSDDGIQRSLQKIEDVLKGKGSESLINRLSGYRSISVALLQAREAIKSYLVIPEGNEPTIESMSLWSFAIIEYCKCYQKNEGWTVTLEPTATIKNESEEIKKWHKWFMSERHNYVAHGGTSSSHQSSVFLIRRKERPFQIDGVRIQAIMAANPSSESMRNLDHLAEVSLKYVEDNSRDIERKIFLSLLEAKQPVNQELLKNYNLWQVSQVNI